MNILTDVHARLPTDPKGRLAVRLHRFSERGGDALTLTRQELRMLTENPDLEKQGIAIVQDARKAVLVAVESSPEYQAQVAYQCGSILKGRCPELDDSDTMSVLAGLSDGARAHIISLAPITVCDLREAKRKTHP